jgi:N-acyl-D-amino-acid deacylase
MHVYDAVIQNASIFDGTGAPAFVGSVAIHEGRIARVFADSEQLINGRETLRAQGLVLCPGFIDVHAHDDFALLAEPEIPWKVLQGVTTVVVGNCGIGAAPFPGAEDWFEKLHPGAQRPSYSEYGGYFDAIDEARPSINVASLAGHGALRNAVAPGNRHALSTQESRKLEREVARAIEAGVLGVSAGLIYEPGVFADEKELVSVLRVAKQKAPLFAVHLRSEADQLLQAVQEAIRVSTGAGVSLQLSHHKAHGRNNWGKVQQSLLLVEQARQDGLDVWLDQYPYTAGSTIFEAVMARGGFRGGPALGQLAASDVVIASSAIEPSWEGKSVAQLAQRWGVNEESAAERILRTDPSIWVVVFAMSEADVRQVLTHPFTLIGSDGLPTKGGRPHPRLFGTFPRILGHYVREQNLLSFTEAVAKMTSRSATRFGISRRGEIREGYWADLVLLDPRTVGTSATYEDPTLPPCGISGVWVNGVRTVQDGLHTGARSGVALRRGARN